MIAIREAKCLAVEPFNCESRYKIAKGIDYCKLSMKHILSTYTCCTKERHMGYVFMGVHRTMTRSMRSPTSLLTIPVFPLVPELLFARKDVIDNCFLGVPDLGKPGLKCCTCDNQQ